jgi:hypothetical protein
MAMADPFSALSFIAGPALLTNASSLLLMGTINRYSRALDRARLLAGKIAEASAKADAGEKAFLHRQLDIAQRRVLLIVRTMTAFYTAIGAFGIGTLAYLIGSTVLHEIGGESIASLVMLGASTLGVLCLVGGTGAMVWESRLSYQILQEEAEMVLKKAGIS